MKDKEKQIEEMRKDIPYLTLDRTVFVGATETKNVSWTLSEEDNKLITEELIKKGWVKLPDSVVLSMEEYEKLLKDKTITVSIDEQLKKEYAYELKQARKETAEKIYNLVDKKLDLYKNGVIGGSLYDSGYQSAIYDVKRTIKELFGVDIKE